MSEFWSEELLSGYLDDELSPSERSHVDAHLKDNPRDRERLRELQLQRELWHPCQSFSVPASFQDQVMRSIQQSTPDQSAEPLSPAAEFADELKTTPLSPPKPKRNNVWSWKATASVLATLATLILIVVVFPRNLFNEVHTATSSVDSAKAVESEESAAVPSEKLNLRPESARANSAAANDMDRHAIPESSDTRGHMATPRETPKMGNELRQAPRNRAPVNGQEEKSQLKAGVGRSQIAGEPQKGFDEADVQSKDDFNMKRVQPIESANAPVPPGAFFAPPRDRLDFYVIDTDSPNATLGHLLSSTLTPIIDPSSIAQEQLQLDDSEDRTEKFTESTAGVELDVLMLAPVQTPVWANASNDLILLQMSLTEQELRTFFGELGGTSERLAFSAERDGYFAPENIVDRNSQSFPPTDLHPATLNDQMQTNDSSKAGRGGGRGGGGRDAGGGGGRGAGGGGFGDNGLADDSLEGHPPEMFSVDESRIAATVDWESRVLRYVLLDNPVKLGIARSSTSEELDSEEKAVFEKEKGAVNLNSLADDSIAAKLVLDQEMEPRHTYWILVRRSASQVQKEEAAETTDEPKPPKDAP